MIERHEHRIKRSKDMTNDKNVSDEGKDCQEDVCDGWLPMEAGGIICDEHGDPICIVINPGLNENRGGLA